ncbi:MAG TPA: YihY/virulence factor BrkB family protein [Methylomirabilota bacterium]|nr:YihY/virulence factor BrkB family protein [Methylomirabilota bacterium]
MKLNPKEMFSIIKEAGTDFMADNAPRLGAALSYYTIFSLSPLLLLVIGIASLWFDANDTRQAIFGQMEGLMGKEGAEAMQEMMVNSGEEKKGLISTIIAGVTLVIGATGAFAQLQAALNQIWEVKQKPGLGVKGFIKTRIMSFTMILVIGFLLLVSLVLSAAVTAMSTYMGHYLPGMDAIWHIVTLAVSFGVVTVLFAMMFKLLPDVKIPWKEVWFGAAVTALLFTVGKFGLGLYLGKSSATSSFGMAGSLVLVLLWVYYSSQILFFGAEITQVHAARRGAHIVPKPHAEWLNDCEKPAGVKPKAEKRPTTKEPEIATFPVGSIPVAAGSAPAVSMGTAMSMRASAGQPDWLKAQNWKTLPALILVALAFAPLGKKGEKLARKKATQDYHLD